MLIVLTGLNTSSCRWAAYSSAAICFCMKCWLLNNKSAGCYGYGAAAATAAELSLWTVIGNAASTRRLRCCFVVLPVAGGCCLCSFYVLASAVLLGGPLAALLCWLCAGGWRLSSVDCVVSLLLCTAVAADGVLLCFCHVFRGRPPRLWLYFNRNDTLDTWPLDSSNRKVQKCPKCPKRSKCVQSVQKVQRVQWHWHHFWWASSFAEVLHKKTHCHKKREVLSLCPYSSTSRS